MLKLMCAGAIAAYAFVPSIVASVVFGADDGFGCRSCLQCGMIPVPAWMNFSLFGLVIGGLTFMGINEIRNKK